MHNQHSMFRSQYMYNKLNFENIILFYITAKLNVQWLTGRPISVLPPSFSPVWCGVWWSKFWFVLHLARNAFSICSFHCLDPLMTKINKWIQISSKKNTCRANCLFFQTKVLSLKEVIHVYKIYCFICISIQLHV